MDYYVVTGVLANGRRFKAIHTPSYQHAMGINLYRGSVWEKQSDGSRKLLKRVWN